MGNGIWCIIIAFLINIYYARTISITITLPSAASPSPVMENHSQAYQAIKWLDTYFGGKVPNFTPPISIQTTPFRKAVYDILLTIPYGQTMTYGEIANIIAKQNGVERMSSQAVGGAVGHNPVSIIIPCHRVVGADGSLTGYAGGLDRKIELLKLEKVT